MTNRYDESELSRHLNDAERTSRHCGGPIRVSVANNGQWILIGKHYGPIATGEYYIVDATHVPDYDAIVEHYTGKWTKVI